MLEKAYGEGWSNKVQDVSSLDTIPPVLRQTFSGSQNADASNDTSGEETCLSPAHTCRTSLATRLVVSLKHIKVQKKKTL